LLHKREDRGDKHVEGENAPLSVHPTDGGSKPLSSFEGFFSWGGENIFDLNLPPEENAQVFVSVSEFDQWPVRILNKLDGRGKEPALVVLGTQDNRFIAVDTQT
jgi:hypothetical protein